MKSFFLPGTMGRKPAVTGRFLHQWILDYYVRGEELSYALKAHEQDLRDDEPEIRRRADAEVDERMADVDAALAPLRDRCLVPLPSTPDYLWVVVGMGKQALKEAGLL